MEEKKKRKTAILTRRGKLQKGNVIQMGDVGGKETPLRASQSTKPHIAAEKKNLFLSLGGDHIFSGAKKRRKKRTEQIKGKGENPKTRELFSCEGRKEETIRPGRRSRKERKRETGWAKALINADREEKL